MTVVKNFKGSQFAQISNSTLRGRQELKDFTIRLHDFLLSQGEDYKVSETALAKHFNKGSATITRAVQELKKYHYLQLQPRGEGRGIEWIVYDQPYDSAEQCYLPGISKGNEITPSEPKKSARAFVVPTMEECISHFIEKGSTKEEAMRFWFFYDSKGWVVGKAKMKSWKSCAGGWISRNGAKETPGKSRMMITDPETRQRGVNPDGSLNLRG